MAEVSPIEWFTLLQSGGIIASFLISAYTAWTQTRSRKVSNYIELVKGHREVWKLQWENKDLAEVLSLSRDVNEALTPKEKRFLIFLFLHITCSYELLDSSNVINLDEMRRDIKELFLSPSVIVFWATNRKFFNSDFCDFVDEIIEWRVKYDGLVL